MATDSKDFDPQEEAQVKFIMQGEEQEKVIDT